MSKARIYFPFYPYARGEIALYFVAAATGEAIAAGFVLIVAAAAAAMAVGDWLFVIGGSFFVLSKVRLVMILTQRNTKRRELEFQKEL